MDSRDLGTELIKPKDQVQSPQKVSHMYLGKAMRFQGHSQRAANYSQPKRSHAKKSRFVKTQISIKKENICLVKKKGKMLISHE